MKYLLIIIVILIIMGLIGSLIEWIQENPVLFVLIVFSILGFIFFRTPIFFVCDAAAFVLYFIIKGISNAIYINKRRADRSSINNNAFNNSEDSKNNANKEIKIPEDIPEDIRESLNKCIDMLKAIKKRNANIPDINITGKINETEQLLTDLIQTVIQNPSNGKKLYRFSDYYLPTTEKLLSQYEVLQNASSNDASTRKLCKDIEHGIDTLNSGISSYLTQIREYQNMDIESDVEVMKDLMGRDGLM